MNKTNKILMQLLPVFILLILFAFVKNEIWDAVLIIFVMLAVFKIKYYKNEIYVFIFGFLLGILLELFGSFVLKFQMWNAIFTMPLWLPLAWGYGFVLIRRIGNIIADKK